MKNDIKFANVLMDGPLAKLSTQLTKNGQIL